MPKSKKTPHLYLQTLDKHCKNRFQLAKNPTRGRQGEGGKVEQNRILEMGWEYIIDHTQPYINILGIKLDTKNGLVKIYTSGKMDAKQTLLTLLWPTPADIC